jgi:hypothetical protein
VQISSVSFDELDFSVSARLVAVEGDPLAFGGPSRCSRITIKMSQLLLIVSRKVTDKDLLETGTLRHLGNAGAVGRGLRVKLRKLRIDDHVLCNDGPALTSQFDSPNDCRICADALGIIPHSPPDFCYSTDGKRRALLLKSNPPQKILKSCVAA